MQGYCSANVKRNVIFCIFVCTMTKTKLTNYTGLFLIMRSVYVTSIPHYSSGLGNECQWQFVVLFSVHPTSSAFSFPLQSIQIRIYTLLFLAIHPRLAFLRCHAFAFFITKQGKFSSLSLSTSSFHPTIHSTCFHVSVLLFSV